MSAKERTKLMEDARAAQRAGKFSDALQLYNLRAQCDDDNENEKYRALVAIGLIGAATGMDRVIMASFFKRAIKMQSDQPAAYLAAACALNCTGLVEVTEFARVNILTRLHEVE